MQTFNFLTRRRKNFLSDDFCSLNRWCSFSMPRSLMLEGEGRRFIIANIFHPSIGNAISNISQISNVLLIRNAVECTVILKARMKFVEICILNVLVVLKSPLYDFLIFNIV